MEDIYSLLDDPKVGTISCFANCPKNKKIAVTFAKSGIIYIYNYKNKLLSEKDHGGKLRTCCFSKDGRFVASGSEEGTVKVWNVKSKSKDEICFIKQDNEKPNRIRSLAFSPDSNLIAVSMYKRKIYIFDVNSGNLVYKIGHFSNHSNENLIGSPCIISDETNLIVGGDDGNCKGYIWKWNGMSDNCKKDIKLKGHTRGIRSITTKGDCIITGSYDTSVIMWDQVGKPIFMLRSHSKPVLYLLFDSNKNRFYSGSEDRSIIVWDYSPDCISKYVTFDNLDDWVRGIFQIDNETITGVIANRISKQICTDLTKYSCKFFKTLYILEFLYIPSTIADIILLYYIFSNGRYGLAALSLTALLLPNIAYFFLMYSKYHENSKRFLKQTILTFLWLKVPIELVKNWRSPTFINKSRVNTKSLRYLKIIDTLFKAIPGLLISIYYFLISPSIKYFKLLQILLSSSLIVKSLSYSFDDLKYDCLNKILLSIYRLIELGTKIGLLSLFCITVYPAYIFVVLIFSSLLHYIMLKPPKSDSKNHWTEKALKHIQLFSNSFAFIFSEEPIVKRSEESGQLVPHYENLIIFGKCNIGKWINPPRNFICPHATVVHVIAQELLNLVLNLGLTVMIIILNPKLKYCAIGCICCSALKWLIAFFILLNLNKMNNQKKHYTSIHEAKPFSK